jgi:hypothetical protein
VRALFIVLLGCSTAPTSRPIEHTDRPAWQLVMHPGTPSLHPPEQCASGGRAVLPPLDDFIRVFKLNVLGGGNAIFERATGLPGDEKPRPPNATHVSYDVSTENGFATVTSPGETRTLCIHVDETARRFDVRAEFEAAN